MKSFTLKALLKLIENSGVEITPEIKKSVTENFNSHVNTKPSRVDARILMIRALIARGKKITAIAKQLNIQYYQVKNALDARATLGEKLDWTPETIQNSTEYLSMYWEKDEFEAIISRPEKGTHFNYSKLTAYEKELTEMN